MQLGEYQIVAFGYLLCQPKKIIWWVLKYVTNICSFKFSEIEIASKDRKQSHKQR